MPCLTRRMADVLVINKANTAPAGAVDKLRAAAARVNPRARVRGRPCRSGRACWAAARLRAALPGLGAAARAAQPVILPPLPAS